MNTKSLKTPGIILAVGLVLALVACLVANVVLTPGITEQEFNYSVTYKLNGEVKTFEGIYRCSYEGYGKGENPRNRYYIGEYTVDGQTTYAQSYTIAEKNGAELYIVTLFNDCYLMGDTKDEGYVPFLDDPYLEAIDREGYPLEVADMPGDFDAEIVSWEYPEPIENTFTFGGFSLLHDGSMLAMLSAGLLTLVACMIFVKRDQEVSYKALDKVSVVLNYVVVLLVIPFVTLVVLLMQLYVSGDELIYQMDLWVPMIIAFTVAASVALRRKGFTKSGFFIQFVGPVLFALLMIFE